MNAQPICPTNHVIVQIDQKFKEDIITEGGVKLFQDTTYRPEWHVTVTGKVVSVPRKVDGYQWPSRGKLKANVEVGDEIAFNYLVVFDLLQTDDREHVFYEDPMGHPTLTQYSNKLGMKILIRYNMHSDRFDVGVFDDNNIVHRVKEKLTATQKDDFLGEYAFAETNKISYNNLLELAGEEYWMVDYGHILAVKKKDYLTPASGRAILSLPEMTMEDHEDAGIILVNPVKKQNSHNTAKIIALGEPLQGASYLDCQPGDKVFFDGAFAESYELWGNPVLVLPHRKLLATV